MTQASSDIVAEVRGQVGFITLNRPKAINALSLGMVRDLYAQLLAWKDDPQVLAVAIRGSNKEGCLATSALAETSAFCTRQAARATRSLKTSLPRSTRSTT